MVRRPLRATRWRSGQLSARLQLSKSVTNEPSRTMSQGQGRRIVQNRVIFRPKKATPANRLARCWVSCMTLFAVASRLAGNGQALPSLSAGDSRMSFLYRQNYREKSTRRREVVKLERRGYCLGLAGGSRTPPPPSHPSQWVSVSASAREKVAGLGNSGRSFPLGEGHDTRQGYPGCLAALGADMSGALLLIACRAADRGYRAQATRSARRAVAMAAVTRARCTGPGLLGSRHPRLGPTWLGAWAGFRHGTDLDSDRRRPHRDSVDAWRCRPPRYDMSDANMTAVPLPGCSAVVDVRECHTPPTESKMAPSSSGGCEPAASRTGDTVSARGR